MSNDSFKAYLHHLNSNDALGDTVGFDFTDGKRYYRVYRIINSGSKSVVSFVDKQTGIIYKPAGWKAPSKTIYGNIFENFPSKLLK